MYLLHVNSLCLCLLQVFGQKEVCAKRVCAASFSAAAADRGTAGCKDPGQRHPGRPPQGKGLVFVSFRDALINKSSKAAFCETHSNLDLLNLRKGRTGWQLQVHIQFSIHSSQSGDALIGFHIYRPWTLLSQKLMY